MALGGLTSVLQTAEQNKITAESNKTKIEAHNNRVKLTTAKNRTKKAQALAALDESVGAAGRGFAKEQAFVNAEVAKMDFAKLAATLILSSSTYTDGQDSRQGRSHDVSLRQIARPLTMPCDVTKKWIDKGWKSIHESRNGCIQMPRHERHHQ